MGRSQRHKVYIQGEDACGKGMAQKQPAPAYIQQYIASQPFTVPFGQSGGPLKGSSIAGYPPLLVPAAGAESNAELFAEPGEWTDPGQFNLSGNPVYNDLPVAGEGGGPGPEPGHGPGPILDSLNPSTAVVGGADITLQAIGSNFTEETVIVFNGGDEPTTFVSDTEVTTGVRPSTASGAAQVEVWVRTDFIESNRLSFEFTEEEETVPEGLLPRPDQGLPPPEAGQTVVEGEPREFPLGPFDITQVNDDGDTLRFMLAREQVVILLGDTVVVEATGNTAVNGTYEVRRVAYTDTFISVVVDNSEVELGAQIEGRGRLTVVEGK